MPRFPLYIEYVPVVDARTKRSVSVELFAQRTTTTAVMESGRLCQRFSAAGQLLVFVPKLYHGPVEQLANNSVPFEIAISPGSPHIFTAHVGDEKTAVPNTSLKVNGLLTLDNGNPCM